MSTNTAPVAIVGIGGMFPGAHDFEEFWANITNAHDAAREVDPKRWIIPVDDAYDPGIAEPDHVYSKRGCFIDEIPSLNTAGIDISSEFLSGLDPSFHLLLHAGLQAFRDAATGELDKSRTGIIIGNLALPTESAAALAREYLGRTLEEKVLGQSRIDGSNGANPLNRYVTGLPAGVLAKALGLGGGTLTLDAACSSSLYALKLAVDELTSGRADAMLTGGLSRPDSLYTQMGFSQLRALSPSGTCSPFDETGDGLVVGEGAGILVLKRVADAVRDGDHIYATIRGVGLSNDIGGGLLAPMSEGQLRAMRGAYAQAGLEPQDIDLVECHATGTPVGDAVEVESLRALWGSENWTEGQCVIGSVKSNVGHLLTAAGSAALIKTLLALKEKTLPPTANFRRSTPGLRLEESPFQVLTTSRPWRKRDESLPRRAAVSAFGFGGINAHVILEEWEDDQATDPLELTDISAPSEVKEVAVVGMDAHFGPWTSLRKFQERVIGSGIDVEPETPENWWGAQSSAWFRLQGLAHYPFRGHFINELPVSPDQFRIPPKELADMLPQQLLMLQVAAGALADSAGEKDIDSPTTGVFIGTGLDLNTTNFNLRWSLIDKARQWADTLGLDLAPDEFDDWVETLRDASGPALTANRTMGGLGSIIASRIAREFRLGGPSFALSSEESSGVRALEMAVRALQRGELDRALVGAVDLAGDVRAVLATHRGRAYSASGNCRPFDERADGSIIGEGATAVVLKPLEDALRDKDKIYAVIKGIGVAGGGGVESLVPSDKAYLQAARRAYDEAGVDIADVSFIEAHGSGSPEEDLMEARALTRLFKENGDRKTLISSAKADIGHTGAASGLAAFVKTCVCLYQEILPPLRHFGRARAELAQPGHRLFAAQQAQYWFRNKSEGPRTAGMSSFSVDGNCTHVVLASYEREVESAVPADRLQPAGVRPEGLFVVEANNVPALKVGLARLRAHVEQKPDQCIEALARHWWRSNREDNSKSRGIALVARRGAELLDQIDFVQHALSEDPEHALSAKGAGILPPFVRDRVFFSPEPLSPDGKVGFIFPGSGNQYLGMGRELAVQWPEIYRKQDAENNNLLSQFQPQVFWNSDSIGAVSKDHKAALFGQVALGTATSDLIQSFGVRPEAVIGYSLGETAGLFALKAWTGRDEMLARINASTLFTEDLAGEYKAARSAWKVPSIKKVDWALGVIDRPAKVVRAALTDHKKVYSLIVNTLHECVIGGDPHAVEKLVRKLDCEFFPLQGVATVHCEVAKEVQEPYRELHVLPATQPRDIRFYSGSWGTDYNVSSESAADSVLAQAIYGIDYPKVIEAAYANGVRLFLEMGPGGSCSRMIGEILADRPHIARSLCVQGQDAVSTVLRMLGNLIAERVPVDLSVLYGLETSLLEHREPEESIEQLVIPVGGKSFDVILPERAESPEPEVPQAPLDPTPEPLAPAFESVSVSAPVFEPVELATASPQVAAAVVAVPGSDILLEQWQAAESIKAEAHASYLRFAESTTQALSEALSFQMSLLKSIDSGATTVHAPVYAPPVQKVPSAAPPIHVPPVDTSTPTVESPVAPAMDREQCMEFAIGSIGKSLGPDFAEVDSHTTRVRLPDEPLMLVDRIVSFHGEPRSLGSGRVVTEHDVLPGAWYLDADCIPVCIAVEAGQADLILSAYLGIDFETRGEAVYRLLDAIVTFHRPLPRPGETIHYDIRIERFFRQGETHLFRFNYDATVNGEPLLTMRNGCAGFFTREELDQGVGVVRTALDLEPAHGIRSSDWVDLVPMAVESYSDEQVDALRRGDLAGCFGTPFENLDLRDPFGLPGGRMKLVDRILELDPTGGRFGLGQIRGEMDVRPDDWFLTCHFVDDMVMPGTLMYECCLHTLRIFVMRMGWIGEADQVAFEPVEGVSGQLKCRGEVNASSSKVIYEVDIKEIGYTPAPFVIADTLMYVDGKPAVEMKNMSLQLTGLTRDFVHQLWSNRAASPLEPAAPLFGYEQILAFSTGNPSDAFGARYKIFDHDRAIARLPRPPYQFLDRIVTIDHEQWLMKSGGEIVAEYDVPTDAWYFESDRRDEMSFAVLLEVALQPCGWFAAYMGSALTSDEDLRFRNLGGKGVQHRAVTPDAGTLATRVRCTSISSSGGMIIQHYTFDMTQRGTRVYTGETYFGYFTKAALADQIGLRDAGLHVPTESERSVHAPFDYPTDAPYPDATLRMVDRVDVFDPKGGPNNLGFIRGTIDVDPAKWFFEAHFYQDPVWPGSLGLEGFVQLLRYVAVERWATNPNPTFEIVALDEEHAWTYRGQIIPADKHVTIEAVITEIDDEQQLIRADGFVIVDGRVIYQMNKFAVRLRKA